MKCTNPDCQEEIHGSYRSCVVCGRDAGHPNVRVAEEPREKAALSVRYGTSLSRAAADGYQNVFERFQHAVSQSNAVICRPLSNLVEIVSSDDALYVSYYRQVAAGIRMPADNSWDRGRESVESAVFPHYYQEMAYGALSLTGIGVTAYGHFSILLKEAAIKERASVFDQPLFPFFRNEKIVVGEPLPLGYRATWPDRGRLAAAKLGSQLTADTSDDCFQAILLKEGTDTETDCVEVHIYGPIHRRAIARVTGSSPHRKADRILVASIKKKLVEVGASLELLK